MSHPLHVAVEVCPVCGNTRRLFTCSACVQSGNFNSSDHNSPYGNARYSERQKRLRLLTSLKQRKSKEVLLHQDQKSQLSKKQQTFNELQLRVEVLKCAVMLAHAQLHRGQEQLESATGQVEERTLSVATAKRRLEQASEIFNSPQIKKQVDGTRHSIGIKMRELRSRRREFICHLIRDIFPISMHTVLPEFGTPPRHTIVTQVSNVDVVLERSVTAESDLEEATRTAYVGGRWISEQEATESEHCILDICLPSSGDYDKYYEWLKSQRSLGRSEGPDSSASHHALPVLSIPAALGYTAQLVEQVASCLNVSLTTKAHHGEFCVHVGARKKFFDAVNRLNGSVMHICFSQGLPISSVDSFKPLYNLDVCLSADNPSLGMSGPFETHPFEVPECPFDSDSSVEELTLESSDSESTGEPGDWDSLMDLRDVPELASDEASTQDGPTDPASASMTASDITSASTRLVTSAAASVAALWPWKKQ